MSARFSPKDVVSWKEGEEIHTGVITKIRISTSGNIAELRERKSGGWIRDTEQPTWKLELVSSHATSLKALGALIDSWHLEDEEDDSAEESSEDEETA
jgi:hypothetical protein